MQYPNNDTEAVRGGGGEGGERLGGREEGGVLIIMHTKKSHLFTISYIYPLGEGRCNFIRSICNQGIRLVPILVSDPDTRGQQDGVIISLTPRLVPILVPDPDTRGQQDGVIISLTPTPITINIWSILQNKNNLTKHYQKKKLIESYSSF